MRRSLAAGILTTLVLAGCGGDDGLSADEYRRQLDAACKQLGDANGRIPATLEDRGLGVDDAQRIADENGRDFERKVRELDPPGDLQDAHDRLRERGDDAADVPDGDDPEALRRYVLELASLYDDLGAKGCAGQQRAFAAQIPR